MSYLHQGYAQQPVRTGYDAALSDMVNNALSQLRTSGRYAPNVMSAIANGSHVMVRENLHNYTQGQNVDSTTLYNYVYNILASAGDSMQSSQVQSVAAISPYAAHQAPAGYNNTPSVPIRYPASNSGSPFGGSSVGTHVPPTPQPMQPPAQPIQARPAPAPAPTVAATHAVEYVEPKHNKDNMVAIDTHQLAGSVDEYVGSDGFTMYSGELKTDRIFRTPMEITEFLDHNLDTPNVEGGVALHYTEVEAVLECKSEVILGILDNIRDQVVKARTYGEKCLKIESVLSANLSAYQYKILGSSIINYVNQAIVNGCLHTRKMVQDKSPGFDEVSTVAQIADIVGEGSKETRVRYAKLLELHGVTDRAKSLVGSLISNYISGLRIIDPKSDNAAEQLIDAIGEYAFDDTCTVKQYLLSAGSALPEAVSAVTDRYSVIIRNSSIAVITMDPIKESIYDGMDVGGYCNFDEVETNVGFITMNAHVDLFVTPVLVKTQSMIVPQVYLVAKGVGGNVYRISRIG